MPRLLAKLDGTATSPNVDDITLRAVIEQHLAPTYVFVVASGIARYLRDAREPGLMTFKPAPSELIGLAQKAKALVDANPATFGVRGSAGIDINTRREWISQYLQGQYVQSEIQRVTSIISGPTP